MMANKKTKTLIFSFDGTGNEPNDARDFKEDESISNVMKLHVLLGGGFRDDKSATKTKAGNQQITYYYNGIGTRENGLSIPLLGWISKKINMAFAPTFGDAGKILSEANADFKKTRYNPGDTLVVFGFSRGAALARVFASKILAENEECEVSFLGVFDTVAAMNGIHRKGDHISSDVVFENGTLNSRIKKAVHILSIDESRVSFTPTLINKDSSNPNRILEVWFPGVHGDIGGGRWCDGMSDVALQFMIKACNKTLGDCILIHPGDDIKCIDKLLKKQGDELAALEVDDIVINPLPCGVLHEYSGLLNQDPRLVCVNDNDRPSKGDLPILHESVKTRFKGVPSYRPSPLRGLEFTLLYDNGETSVVKGINGLR